MLCSFTVFTSAALHFLFRVHILFFQRILLPPHIPHPLPSLRTSLPSYRSPLSPRNTVNRGVPRVVAPLFMLHKTLRASLTVSCQHNTSNRCDHSSDGAPPRLHLLTHLHSSIFLPLHPPSPPLACAPPSFLCRPSVTSREQVSSGLAPIPSLLVDIAV